MQQKHFRDEPSTSDKPDGFRLRARLMSFKYAAAGLLFVVRTQHNAWVHLVATCGVLAAGFLLEISWEDWRWIGFAIVWVWFAEILNTAIENLCDVVSPEHNDAVKHAKDVAAAAVLVSAIGAAFIGLSVFARYI